MALSRSPVPVHTAVTDVVKWLDSFGAKHGPVTTVKLSTVNVAASQRNQARETALIPDAVERYTRALQEGAVFPPIVLTADGIIVDGNNRFQAHRNAGIAGISAIVLARTTSDELITLLTVAANRDHGVTPSAKWRALQGLHLVDLGYTIQAAADAAGVNANEIYKARSLREGQARAITLKISGWGQLPASTQRGLHQAFKSDTEFTAATRLVIDTDLPWDDLRALIRDVKAITTSERDRLAFIAKIRVERLTHVKPSTRTGKLTSPKANVSSAAGKMMAARPAAVLASVTKPDEAKALSARLLKAAEFAMDMSTALDERAATLETQEQSQNGQISQNGSGQISPNGGTA